MPWRTTWVTATDSPRQHHVLVVDDSMDVREFTARVVQDAGYEVITATHGAEALRLASVHPIDLVLSDVVMPVMDGLELCGRIRSQAATALLPVLLISSKLKDPETVAAALRAGADDYLEAPFEPLVLVSKIGRTLERRKLEQAALRQQALTEAVAASLAEGVCAADASGRLTAINAAAARAFGCAEADLLGQSLFTHLRGAAGADSSRAIDRALHQGTITRVEHGALHRCDGSTFPAAFTVAPIRERETVVGVVLTFSDITERTANLERLRSNEAMLMEAQRISQLGSWTWDVEGNHLAWSPELYRILGRDPADGAVPVADLPAVVYGTHGDKVAAATLHGVATGEPFEIELEIVRPNGERRWVVARGEPFQVEGRTVSLNGTVQDVTEARKQHRLLQLSEQRLKAQREMLEGANRRLEQTERRYRDLVENLNDVVYVLDRSGVFQYVSPAVRRYGYEPADLIGQHIRLLVHPDDLGSFEVSIGKVAAGLTEPSEFRAVDRNGEWHYIRTSGRAAYDSGVCTGITGVLFDVTRERRAEEQLRGSQRLEAVGRLAGGVAHDFNNLLVAINGYAEFALGAVHPDDPIHGDLREILQAGNRAAALTRQLLAFSRKQVLNPKHINLNDIVSGMQGMLRRLIGEDIDFVTVLPEGLPTVLADPGQIEQVVMNLAVNARDAMPTGGRLIVETALVGNDKGPSFVRLSVTDTGCGMDEETRARIFEPFFTTKPSGEGTGLGLPMVHGIVTQSGGTVEVETTVGRGTTFRVTLPAVEQTPEIASAPVHAPSGRGSETILLVEDEPAVRALARRFLSAAGYKVLVAASGGDALLICEKHQGPIDLLLTDVVMPQMSGRELAERLSRVRPGLLVLYMSGYSGTAIARHGVLVDGVRLIEKPFNSGELTRAVRRALEDLPGAGHQVSRNAELAPGEAENTL